MVDERDDRRLRFERLYERHRAPVLAYFVRRIARDDAEDSCAETFLVAWRRIEDVPDDGALPYLYGIASRVLANRERSTWRRRRLVAKAKGAEVVEPNDPITIVMRRDVDRSVEAEVRRLPAKYRDVVMLYAWEDLPRAQIASVLGISKSAVDQRLHRAYRRLARSIRHESVDAAATPFILEEGGAR